MTDQPAQDTQAQQTPAAAPPADPSHMPMIDRVAAIEDTLTQLIARHNAFINTVVKELGL